MVLVPAATLGSLDPATLADGMRPLWEDAGPLVGRMVGVEVGSWSEHVDRAEEAIAAMDDATRVELLRAHPRIGTPPHVLMARSRTSLAEQGGVHEEPAVLAMLQERNDIYERRFGFPFVEWVAGRSRRDICEVLDARSQRDRRTELTAGCNALVAIARDRLARAEAGAAP